MPDKHYPSVDVKFIIDNMIASDKLVQDGHLKIGQTNTFVVAGNQAMHKRTILVRELEPGQVVFEQATGLAIRFGFMGALLNWFEINRSWKDGAYVEPPVQGESKE